MKNIFLLFFLFTSWMAEAQVQDNFDDGEFAHSPVWTGDTADFIVNSSLQLQLNAGAAGNSRLATACNPDMFTDLEWRFFIHLNFSPSSGNYARIYLVSDQEDLKGPLNGYYLQFGESLANDAVELFRQDGTASVSICRATDGAIASAFSISVKVTRDRIGLWSLWIDYSGAANYQLETYGAEALYTSSAYFGIFCDYTSGNRSNFYFDDVYVGPLLHDTIAPLLETLQIQSSTGVTLHFNEAMDPLTAGNVNNYFLDGGIGNPIAAVVSSTDPAMITLTFLNSFVPAFQHTLLINNVTDLSGNIILPGSQINFTYYPPVIVLAHDIIFTEIMFEPSSSGGLPNFEYVEIYNRNAGAISLKNWTISDGSSTAVFPDVIILPGSYLILCNTSAANSFIPFGNTLGLSSFPVLNNDVGDHLQLKNADAMLIEELTFSNQTYRDGSKDDGGYSLERIDKSFVCTDPLNWKASNAVLGGTPGQVSSVQGIYTDRERPVLLRASLVDSTLLSILFSEKMDSINVNDPLMYLISSEGSPTVHPDSVLSNGDDASFTLRLPFAAKQRIYELSVNYGLKDCPGNDLDISQNVRFAFPQKVEAGDVVINELLFNPQSGGSDFVELFNRSQKVFDVFHWRIAEAPYQNIAAAQSSKALSNTSYLFFPGEYIVVTGNLSDIRMRYETPGMRPFISSSDFPDFNSTNGAVILYDSLGMELDHFSYSDDLHFPLLIDKKGVSLERLSPEHGSNEESNWHSASSGSGFATPAYRNSVGWRDLDQEAELTIEPKVFSPDNDGYNDLLFIKLNQAGKQGVAKVLIYDLQGRLMRILASQEIIGDVYDVVWNGLTDKGELATLGTYIIFTEVYYTDGKVKRNKMACFLTMK